MDEPLIDLLSEPFPDNAIEERQGGGGKMLSYVATETVIRRLNRVCPNGWSFRITDKQERNNVLIVWGELEIPPLGTRAGTGVQALMDRPGTEDMVKGAASDCLKKCATLFGVGIDLYGPDLEAGELPDGPVVQDQIATIRTIIERKKINPDDVRQMAGGKAANQLTRAEADRLIQGLQRL